MRTTFEQRCSSRARYVYWSLGGTNCGKSVKPKSLSIAFVTDRRSWNEYYYHYFIYFLFGRQKSRCHNHGHGRLGADFGHFEAFSLQIKLFQNEIQCRFEPLQNQQKSFVRGFCNFRFWEPILAILKLFAFKPSVFTIKFFADLSPCNIEQKTFFWIFLDLGSSIRV